MRHKLAFRHLSRSASHRRALFRNMATSLFKYERFETTLPKAKELRRIVEPLVRLGAEDNLNNRRKAFSYLLDKVVVRKLFSDIGPRFKSRPGGYTRIVRTRVRHGDAAQMALIELLSEVRPMSAPAKSPSSESKQKSEGEEKKSAKKAKAPKAEGAAGAAKSAKTKASSKQKA